MLPPLLVRSVGGLRCGGRIERVEEPSPDNAHVGPRLLPLPRDICAKCEGRALEKRLKINRLREPY
jgi:hypothetical protein